MQKTLVEKLLERAVKAVLDIETEVEVTLGEPQFGDFNTNIAFKLAQSTGSPPKEIAQQIIDKLSHKEIVKAEVAGGGFINLTMSDTYWAKEWEKIRPDFIKNQLGKGKKVQVEFISANPTGPLTLGNARGGFVGDVLANVLAASGFSVVREYYFNDAGSQIGKLVESVKAEAGLVNTEDRQYQGEYIKEITTEIEDKITTLTDDKLKKLLTQTIFNRHIKPAIQKMNIQFDVWSNESELINKGVFDQTLEALKEEGAVFERDGAVWLNTGKGGDPRQERVLIKSSGEPAYFAPDIAYHYNIFRERNFDRAIKVLGADHVAQFPSVKAAVKILAPEKELEAVIVQWVRLIRAGEEISISKRSGTFVTVEELIDEVGSDVARFFMLMRSNDTHMDFDLDLAKERSQKNPLWYVQYAFVRACSILEQAAAAKLEPASGAPSSLTVAERALIRQLSQLPNLVTKLAQTREVHKLSFWGIETAKLFHEYYEADKIIDLDKEKAETKLYLISQFILAMEQYFALLGIKPLKRM